MVRGAAFVHRQLISGIQIVLTEHIEVRIQRGGRLGITCKVQAQAGDLGSA